MLSLKKKLSTKKIEHLFAESRILCLFQYHALNSKQWLQLRRQLALINAKLLVVKNSLVHSILQETNIKKQHTQGGKTTQSTESTLHTMQMYEHFCRLFQTNSVIISCMHIEDMKQIFQWCDNPSHFLFLGGMLNKQIMTHHEFRKLLTLNDSVYVDVYNLLHQCLSRTQYTHSFQTMSSLVYHKHTLMYLLQKRWLQLKE